LLNLIAYFLTVTSNILVIVFVPERLLDAFVTYYAGASMIVGTGVVYIFSSDAFSQVLKRYVRKTFLALAFNFFLAIVVSSFELLVTIYAISILASDYYVTQAAGSRTIYAYRLSLAISTFIFLLFLHADQSAFTWLLTARTVLALVFILFIKADRITSLNLTSPLRYIAGTHLVYFGSLALLPWISSGIQLKNWYVTYQVGYSALLKIADFTIRQQVLSEKNLLSGAAVFSMISGIGAAIIFGNCLAMVLYLFGIALLYLIVRASVRL